jgi:hypothetical protein
VGKVKRADVYLEVRKRREHTYLNETLSACVKGILSTKIVFVSYPKLLSFSVLTFIK